MHVDTDALRYFQQVADGVTVTEVAAVSRVTQPGVSRALARLEGEVGLDLLQRSGRGVRTTRAGAAFKRHVDRSLHALDDGLAELATLADPGTGSVSVAFQRSLGTWLVPRLVAGFAEQHPEVRFEFHQLAGERVGPPSGTVAETDVDVEITTVRPSGAGLRWRPLIAQPLVVALARDHRLARRHEIDLAELADDPFVVLRPVYLLRRTTEDLCRAAGFVPRIAFEADDLPSVEGFVAAGLGVSVVPHTLEGHPDVRHRPVAGGRATRDIGITWSGERRLLPAAESFRRYVVDHARRVSGHPGS